MAIDSILSRLDHNLNFNFPLLFNLHVLVMSNQSTFGMDFYNYINRMKFLILFVNRL